MSEDLPEENKSAPFEKMRVAAQKAKEDLDLNGTSDPASAGLPRDSMTEEYQGEITKNMQTYRKMRWVSFIVIGGLCLIFLVALGCMLLHFLGGHRLESLLGASSANWSWHILVLVAGLFGIFALVPLTLGMALMRMVSQTGDEQYTVKFPTAEAARLCANTFASMLQK